MSVIPVGGGGGGPSLPPVGGPPPSMPLPAPIAPPGGGGGGGPSLFAPTFFSILPAPKITLLEYSNVVSKSINEARSVKNEADSEIDNAEKAIRLNLAQYAALIRNLLSTARRLGPTENALFTTINAQVTDFNSTILPPFFAQLQSEIDLLNNAIAAYNAAAPTPATAAVLQLAIDSYTTQTAAINASYFAAAALFNNSVAINNAQLAAINVARAQFNLAPLALEPTAPNALDVPIAPAPFAAAPLLPTFVTPLQTPYAFTNAAQTILLNTINAQIAAQNTNISTPYANQITAAINTLNAAIADFNNNLISDVQLQTAVDNYNTFSATISAGYAASAAAFNTQVDANNIEIGSLNASAAALVPPGALMALQQPIPLAIALPPAPLPFLIPPLFLAPISALTPFAFAAVPSYPGSEDDLVSLVEAQITDFNTNVLSPLFVQAQNAVTTLNNAINTYNTSLFTETDQIALQQAIDDYNGEISTINNSYSLQSTSFNNQVTDNNSQLAAFNVSRATLSLPARPLEEAAPTTLGLTTAVSPFSPVAAIAPFSAPAPQSLYDTVTSEQQALSDAINSQINDQNTNITIPYSAQITALIATLNTAIDNFNNNLITDVDLQAQIDDYNNNISIIINNYAISAAAFNGQVALNNSALLTANQNAALLYPNAAVFMPQDTIPAALDVPVAPLPPLNAPIGFTQSLVWPSVAAYLGDENALAATMNGEISDYNNNILPPILSQAQNVVSTLDLAIQTYNSAAPNAASLTTLLQAITDYNAQTALVSADYLSAATTFNGVVAANNVQLNTENLARQLLLLPPFTAEQPADTFLAMPQTPAVVLPGRPLAALSPPPAQGIYNVMSVDQQTLADTINGQISDENTNVMLPYSTQITALIATLNGAIDDFNNNLITDVDLQVFVDSYNSDVTVITNDYATSAAAFNAQVAANNAAIATANQDALLLYPANAAVLAQQEPIPAALTPPPAPLPIFVAPIGFTPSIVGPSVAAYPGDENALAATMNAQISDYNDNILPPIILEAQNAISILNSALQTYNSSPLTSVTLATVQQAIADYQAQAALTAANYLGAATAFNNLVTNNNIQLSTENLARQLQLMQPFPLEATAATLLSMPPPPAAIPPSTLLPPLSPPVQELYDVVTVDQQTLTSTINGQIDDQNTNVTTPYSTQITALIATLNSAIDDFNNSLITDVDLQAFVDAYNSGVSTIANDYAISAAAFNAEVVANNSAIATANQDAALLYPVNAAVLAQQEAIPDTLTPPAAPLPPFNVPIGFTQSLVWPAVAAYPGDENALAATINAQISDYNTNILPPIVLQAQNAISTLESALQVYNSAPEMVGSIAVLQQAITDYNAQIALISADYLGAAISFNNNVAINNGQLAVVNADRALLSLPPFSNEVSAATSLVTPTLASPSILPPLPLPQPFALPAFSSMTPEQQSLVADIAAEITAENDNVITPTSLQITTAIDALNSAITDFNNNVITDVQLQAAVDTYNATAAAITISYTDSATAFNAQVAANNSAILIANQNALLINPNGVLITYEAAMPETISMPAASLPPFIAPVVLSTALTLPLLGGYAGSDDALLVAINGEIADFNVNIVTTASTAVQAAIDTLNNAITIYNGIMPPSVLSQADLALAVSNYNAQITAINNGYLIAATTFNQSVTLNNEQIAAINLTRAAHSLPPYVLQELAPTALAAPAAPPPPTAIPIPALPAFVPFSMPLYNFMTPEQAAIIATLNGQIDLQNSSFSTPYAAMITAAIDSLNISINDFNNNLITDVQLQTQIDAYNATATTIMSDYASSAAAFNAQVALNNAAIQTLNQDTLQLNASAAILSIEKTIPATITLPSAALPPLVAPVAGLPAFTFPVVPPYPGLDFTTLSQSLLAPMLSVGFSFFSNYDTAQRWAADFRNYQRFVVSKRKSYLLSLFLQGLASVSGDPALNSVGFTGLARTTSHVLETLLSGNMIQAVERYLGVKLTATSMHELRLFNLALLQQTAIAAVLPALGHLQDHLTGLTPDSDAIQIALATEFIKQLTQITATEQFSQQIAKLLSQTPELANLSAEQLAALVSLLSTATTLSLVKAALLQLAVVLQTPGLLANLLKNIPELKSLLGAPRKSGEGAAPAGAAAATIAATAASTSAAPKTTFGPVGPVKVSQTFQISEAPITDEPNTVDTAPRPIVRPIERILPTERRAEAVQNNRRDPFQTVRENEPPSIQETDSSTDLQQQQQLQDQQTQDQQIQDQQLQDQQIQDQQPQDQQTQDQQTQDQQQQSLRSVVRPSISNKRPPYIYKPNTEPATTPRLPPNILPIQRPPRLKAREPVPPDFTTDVTTLSQKFLETAIPTTPITANKNLNPLQEQTTQEPSFVQEPPIAAATYKERTPDLAAASLLPAAAAPPQPPSQHITSYNQLFSQQNFSDRLVQSLQNTLPTAPQQARPPVVEPLTSAIRATAAQPATTPENFFSSFGNNLVRAGFTPEQSKSLTIRAAELSITTQTPIVLASNQTDQGEYLRSSERLLTYLHSRQFIPSRDTPPITNNVDLQQGRQQQQIPYMTQSPPTAPLQRQQPPPAASSASSGLFQESVLKNSIEQAVIAKRGVSQQQAEQIAKRLVDRITARSPEFDNEQDLRRALAQELLGVKSNRIGQPFSFQEARALAQQLEIATTPTLSLEQQPLMNPNVEGPAISLDLLATALQKHVIDLLTPQVGVEQAGLLSQGLLQQLFGAKTPQTIVQEELKAPLSIVNVLKKEFKKMLDKNNVDLRNEAAKQFRELLSPTIDLFAFVQRLLDPANSLVLSSMTGLMYSSKPVGGKEHPLQFYA